MARLDVIDRDIALLLKEDLSPEAASRALADFAAEALSEAQQHNARVLGRTPDHETFVDGRSTDAIDTVKPDGTIVFDFELLDELFGWIDLQLIANSPYRKGGYRASHILLADGVEVDPTAAVLPEASEFVYVSTVPYSRKVERKYGVYQGIALMANRRFGNYARISFGFRSVVGAGALNDWAKKSRLVRAGSPAKREDWLRRQPAIIVTVR